MKIMVLFAQRKCAYDGEYAPECLEVMSEYDFEENTTFLKDKLQEAVDSGEFESVKVIPIEVPDDGIKGALSLVSNTLSGVIQD
ncbi:hypothetical protein [Vibrio alginolyticus]|uniref:hypothetical protein n=1 Tax=Vibrio alginolyticus TaxID=663 RepID=UPI0006CAA8EF|nr:hypothetical protein [Vibrio alginolyticus]KPM97622.1 hypothetical protein AOG25_14255 [Vibrio alginolyticus]CAH7372825.1 conserved hypothetical protein [Vibrio chagasii]